MVKNTYNPVHDDAIKTTIQEFKEQTGIVLTENQAIDIVYLYFTTARNIITDATSIVKIVRLPYIGAWFKKKTSSSISKKATLDDIEHILIPFCQNMFDRKNSLFTPVYFKGVYARMKYIIDLRSHSLTPKEERQLLASKTIGKLHQYLTEYKLKFDEGHHQFILMSIRFDMMDSHQALLREFYETRSKKRGVAFKHHRSADKKFNKMKLAVARIQQQLNNKTNQN